MVVIARRDKIKGKTFIYSEVIVHNYFERLENNSIFYDLMVLARRNKIEGNIFFYSVSMVHNN